MPDFESGAFNRALPPLRYLTPVISMTYRSFLQGLFDLECASVRLVLGVDEAIDSRCLVLRSEME
jgi:hypothetical protein